MRIHPRREIISSKCIYEFFTLKDTAKLEWRTFSCEGALPGAEAEIGGDWGGKSMGFQIRHIQVQTLALPSSCVTLDKSLNLSELLFP